MEKSGVQTSVNRQTFWEIALIVVTLLLTTFFRTHLFRAAPPGLQHDEIFKANFAAYILQGERPAFFDANGGEEALYPYLTALSLLLLGENYFALRLVAVFSGILSVALIYRLIRELFGRKVGLLTAAGVAVSFWHIFDSRLALRPITLLLLELLCFYFFWLGLRRSGEGWFLLSGLFLGLTQYTYTSAPLVAVTILVFALYLLTLHRGLLRHHLRGLVLLFLVALLVTAPMAYHVYRNPVASTARARDLSDHLNLLLQGEPGPILRDVVNVLGIFSLRGDPEWRYNLAGRPLFDPLTSTLFLGGVIISLRNFKRPQYAFLLLWLPINLTASAITRASPSTLRAIGALGAIYTFPSLTLMAAWGWLSQSKRAQGAALGGITLLFLFTASSTYRDYFLLWATNPEVRNIYRGDLTEVASYLKRRGEGNFCLSAQFAADLDQEILYFMLNRRPPMRWFNGQNSLVFPPEETTTYIFPATGPLRKEFQTRYFASLPVAHTALAPRGEPAFVAYRVKAEEVARFRDMEPQYPLGVNLGDKVELLGYDLLSLPGAGEDLTLLLHWRVLEEVGGDRNYSFFAHLVDSQGYLWAQTDSLGYPPSSWHKGDRVVEWFSLSIPPDTPPREYQLSLGMYDRATGERLKAAGEPFLDSVALEPVAVAKASPLSQAGFEPPQPCRVRFSGELTLLGREISRRRVAPGEKIHISLWWRAQERRDTDYEIYIFLQNEEGDSWGEIQREPLDGEYPTSRWEAGEIVRDRFDYLIPPDTPPGRYQVKLRLLDGKTGACLPLAEGSGESVTLDRIRVLERQREFILPSPQHPMKANLGDQVTFLGYEMEVGEAGRVVRLALYWQAQKEMEASYTVFTHLLDTKGALWAQKDNPPQGGRYPTTGWLEGEVVRDEYEIPLPSDTPPGLYLIEVGMYQAETGERLPAFDEEGRRLEGDRILLPTPLDLQLRGSHPFHKPLDTFAEDGLQIPFEPGFITLVLGKVQMKIYYGHLSSFTLRSWLWPTT